MTIELTEALKFYFLNEVNQNAVEQLIATKDAPEDFSIKDTENFYLSKVNALQVQTDFWILLKDLWESTWGITLKNIELSMEAFNTLSDVFENNWFNKTFSTKDCEFCCGVEIDFEKQSFLLVFYIEKNKIFISNDLNLSDLWQTELYDDNYRATDITLCKITDSNEIKGLESLMKAAKDATDIIKKSI